MFLSLKLHCVNQIYRVNRVPDVKTFLLKQNKNVFFRSHSTYIYKSHAVPIKFRFISLIADPHLDSIVYYIPIYIYLEPYKILLTLSVIYALAMFLFLYA